MQIELFFVFIFLLSGIFLPFLASWRADNCAAGLAGYADTSYNRGFLKLFFCLCPLLSFSSAVILVFKYKYSLSSFGLSFNWHLHDFASDGFNVATLFAYDSISLCFMILTALLLLLCCLYIAEESSARLTSALLNCLSFCIFIAFSTSNLLLFYIAFEATLFPMYNLIVQGGSRERKIWAANLLFFYTLCCSLPFLLSIAYVYTHVHSFDMPTVAALITKQDQVWLWLGAFIAFASKIPLFPVHIWLPEAHVEAPTTGSVMLAGILLKLGVYGFLRVSLGICFYVTKLFSPYLVIFIGFGVLYSAYSAMRQTDIKRIIAYSSISHMSVAVLGIFSCVKSAVSGAIVLSISHGLISAGLFFMVGMLYKRYHTRSTQYYGGLVVTSPLFAIFFTFFNLANIGIPGTSSFTSEFMILAASFQGFPFLAIICGTSVILSSAYSLWLCNKILFGNLKNLLSVKFSDLEASEFFILFVLAFLSFYLGVYPDDLILFIETSDLFEIFKA